MYYTQNLLLVATEKNNDKLFYSFTQYSLY